MEALSKKSSSCSMRLQQFGVSLLEPAEQRVWRPSELAYPSDPQRSLKR